MAKRPKIRHLAIITLEPERLAKFYEQTFEMTRLHIPGAAQQHPLRRLGHRLARLAQREVRHALLA